MIFLVPAILCISCAAAPDTRTQMLRASRQSDPNFPDGTHRKLTQFAYIGDVAAKGVTLHVVAARSVITGMLAPRGQAWLSFYDVRGGFVGEHAINPGSPPLWCDGSRVYFFGLQTNGEQQGNALDLRDGFANRRYVLAPAEGSWTPITNSQAAN